MFFFFGGGERFRSSDLLFFFVVRVVRHFLLFLEVEATKKWWVNVLKRDD